MYEVTRYHDFSAGHRVVGHENKCKTLHGHNYRVHFTVRPDETLDNLGRVIDFGVIKSLLCEWLEVHWDHMMILWEADPIAAITEGLQLHDVTASMPTAMLEEAEYLVKDSIVLVPFNPTAENMAAHLVNVVGPRVLEGSGVHLHSVKLDETRKCSATYTRSPMGRGLWG
jgi:6-pyruvoyltetrahydropterin/6-carboxytetrahydropterin synthase